MAVICLDCSPVLCLGLLFCNVFYSYCFCFHILFLSSCFWLVWISVGSWICEWKVFCHKLFRGWDGGFKCRIDWEKSTGVVKNTWWSESRRQVNKNTNDLKCKVNTNKTSKQKWMSTFNTTNDKQMTGRYTWVWKMVYGKCSSLWRS